MLKDYDLKQLVSPLLQWFLNHARVLPWREETDSIPGVGFGDHAPADESGGGKAVF